MKQGAGDAVRQCNLEPGPSVFGSFDKSAIDILFLGCGPGAIAGRVSEVHVASLYREGWLVAVQLCPSLERRKIVPFHTERNSPTPIVFEAGKPWVRTARPHRFPNAMKARPGAAVSLEGGSRGLPLAAATRCGFPTTKVRPHRRAIAPTVANAVPESSAVGRVPSLSQDQPTAEALAAHIDQSRV